MLKKSVKNTDVYGIMILLNYVRKFCYVKWRFAYEKNKNIIQGWSS